MTKVEPSVRISKERQYMNPKHTDPKFWKITPSKRQAMAKTMVELHEEVLSLREQLARLIIKCQENNIPITDEDVPSMV